VTEERWQRLTYWPLIGVSLLFIAVYSWEVIANLHGEARAIARTVVFITWVIFAIDYAVRFLLASPRGKWFTHHIFDLLIVVLPALKPLRLLRVFTVFTVLQRTVGSALRSRIAIYGTGTAIVLIWVSSLAVLDAERGHPGANIENFGDAIWWAFVTLTTVGYGDFYPVTGWGRTIAVGLMVSGVAVVGIVTATLASWVIEKAAEGRDDDEPATRKQMRELTDEVTEIKTTLGTGGS